jgi:hypothetical protein
VRAASCDVRGARPRARGAAAGPPCARRPPPPAREARGGAPIRVKCIYTAVFVDFIFHLAQTPGLPRRSVTTIGSASPVDVSCGHVSRDARRRPSDRPSSIASFLDIALSGRYGIPDAERGHAVAPQSQRPHRSRSVRARTVYVDTPRPPLLCRTHSSPPRLPPVRLWHRAE